MTRECYDSIDPNMIPADAAMLLYYVDGLYGPDHAAHGQPGWDQAALDRFPNAVKVGVAVFETTDAGTVGDMETGDMTAAGLVRWVVRRRAAGVDPTGYCSLDNWGTARQQFEAMGVLPPHWLIAWYDGVPLVPDGAIGKQYANQTFTGRNLDVSVVADYWPGVDPPPLVLEPSPIDGLWWWTTRG